MENLSWELWLAFGVALLAAEALGASGFLIGAAVAAIAQAILVWLMPELSLVSQIVIYAITAVIATVVYFQVFRDVQADDDTPPINARTARMTGTIFTLDEDIERTGRVQIGDTYWKVETPTAIPAGTEVEVTSTKGMALVIQSRS